VDPLLVKACTDITSATGGVVEIDAVSGWRAGDLDYVCETIPDAKPCIVDVDSSDVQSNDQIAEVVIQDPRQRTE
jgi:hypothetical protein